MSKALIFAAIAAFGNAIFVFGQRRSSPSSNPFVFMAGAVFVCTLLFFGATLVNQSGTEPTYLTANWSSILISGCGFFITFIGFFLLYSRFGAVYYGLYAVLSILTTSVGVGVLIYKEPINPYQITAVGLAVLAVILFSYGQAVTK